MIDMYLKYIAESIANPNELVIPKSEATNGQIEVLLQLVFTIAGVVAVIVIIIAGISYILSAGDPQKTAKAKNTILYALIGLVVAILANVIVSFVIGRVFG